MRYLLLATDYDGTLASHGVVSDQTVSLLQRVRASGRKIVLVTGRHLPDLKNIFPQLDLFPRVVAENGALLYRPADNFSKLLCAPAMAALAQKLAEAGARPLSVGRAIIATREPYETVVIELIKELGLELPKADGFRTIAGQGIEAKVGDRTVVAGNRALMTRNGIVFETIATAAIFELS